ncbi:MAG: AAA family ATPase [Coriobacteriales bacterium]|jgi:hypothetical protein
MIQGIYIRNFRAWSKGVFKLFGGHTVFLGDNDTGKTSILEALDYFFNHTKMDSSCYIDPHADIHIGVRVNGQEFRRIYDARTHEARLEEREDDPVDWNIVNSMRYVYVPASGKSAARIAAELVAARAVELAAQADVASALQEASLDAARELLGETAVADDGGAIARILPARAIDIDLGRIQRAFADTGKYSQWNKLLARILETRHGNVILGIDDMEETLLVNGDASDIVEIEKRVGQMLMTTRASELVTTDNDTAVYTVGGSPSPRIAEMIGQGAPDDATFVFVEGQYDLPWFRKALELLGIADTHPVLPGGGSNVDVLLTEFRKLGFKSVLIRDGDMSSKDNPRNGIYSLKRDCIEMYAPKQLLLDCFGRTATRTKDMFFRELGSGTETFAPEVRRNKSHFSPDDIKAVLAERIEGYLTADNPFVQELREILCP